MDPQGNHVGYMAERDGGMGSMLMRQSFRTHRSFVTHVFDRHQNEVLRVRESINQRKSDCLTKRSFTGRFPGSTPGFEYTILWR
jgi:hypothetical protein